MAQPRPRKGIILSGGSGTRLYPLTRAVSKQLLPVYDKPMIYYPLATLMLAGIRDMLIITTPDDAPLFHRLLGDGRQWGVSFTYAEQSAPRGIAEALIIAEDFLDGAPSALILGDNIFYGVNLPETLQRVGRDTEGATVFGYAVNDPERYGVVELARDGTPRRLVEKPVDPPSNIAITGLYFYDDQAPAMAKSLAPSPRGELEITDLNQLYLERGRLRVEQFGRGYAWLDAGTHASLLEASQFIQVVEGRQGLKVCCPEEIAFRMGTIDAEQLRGLAESMGKTDYAAYLFRLLKDAAARSAD